VLDATQSYPERFRIVRESPDLSVSGAVVQYRPRHLIGTDRQRIDDIGVALVLDGQCAAACSALELGSGSAVELDLSHELVVLGWVDLDTLEEVRRLAEHARPSGRVPTDAGPFCFGIALRSLKTLGYSTITRPSLLRIGFRDVLRDVDPDGARAIRFALSTGQIARVALDADANSLRVVLPRESNVGAAIESALTEAFPAADLRRLPSPTQPDATGYEVRLPLPLSMSELRALIEQMRAGITHLFWRFEPDRSQVVAEQLATFGRRDSLGRLEPDPPAEPRASSTPLPATSSSQVVH